LLRPFFADAPEDEGDFANTVTEWIETINATISPLGLTVTVAVSTDPYWHIGEYFLLLTGGTFSTTPEDGSFNLLAYAADAAGLLNDIEQAFFVKVFHTCVSTAPHAEISVANALSLAPASLDPILARAALAKLVRSSIFRLRTSHFAETRTRQELIDSDLPPPRSPVSLTSANILLRSRDFDEVLILAPSIRSQADLGDYVTNVLTATDEPDLLPDGALQAASTSCVICRDPVFVGLKCPQCRDGVLHLSCWADDPSAPVNLQGSCPNCRGNVTMLAELPPHNDWHG
jgi:hypothetical protein